VEGIRGGAATSHARGAAATEAQASGTLTVTTQLVNIHFIIYSIQ
jgi:hypothetical protein